MKLKTTLLFFAFISILKINAQTVKIGATSYATITEAITAAVDGDIIDITGVHTEPISIGKSITLRGTDPTTDIIQEATTASSDGSGVGVINVIRAEDADILNVTIENLGIRNGNSINNGGGINVDKVKGLLTLKNLIIENNNSNKNGGGLGLAGSNVEIVSCTVQNNNSSLDGGGLIMAPNNGAGIDNIVQIKRSLINNNTGRNGGGIYINGNNNFGNNYKIDILLENSTISNNTTFSLAGGNGGGAIFTASANLGSNPLISNVTLKLVHATVYNNSHASANKAGLQFAGINTTNFSTFNSIIVANDDLTIKALNFANTNTTDVINCILGGLNAAPALVDDAAKNNQKGKTATQAGLTGSLTNEGGKTQVLAITSGSTADDFCTVTVPISLPSIDQRGATREGTPDAGAYEFVGTLGIKNNDKGAKLALYPNPASNMVTVKGFNKIESIKVFSILGSLELNVTNSDNFDVSKLSSGIYMVQITSDNRMQTVKLIKK